MNTNVTERPKLSKLEELIEKTSHPAFVMKGVESQAKVGGYAKTTRESGHGKMWGRQEWDEYLDRSKAMMAQSKTATPAEIDAALARMAEITAQKERDGEFY